MVRIPVCVGVVNPAATGVVAAVAAAAVTVVACVVAAAVVAVADDVTVVAAGLLPNNPPGVPVEYFQFDLNCNYKKKLPGKPDLTTNLRYQCVCVVEPVLLSHYIVMVCSRCPDTETDKKGLYRITRDCLILHRDRYQHRFPYQ